MCRIAPPVTPCRCAVLRHCLPALVAILVLAAQGAAVELASQGQARLAVVVAPEANQATRAAAETLAAYLGRIAGADFQLQEGDGRSGIAVGSAGDFPRLQLDPPWPAGDQLRREEYLIRSTDNGLQLLGASDQAVQHAVWDLLYRLGHRQFFPGPRWEIVPRSPDLQIELDIHARPDYAVRRIWYGFGPWDYATEPYQDWCVKNRAVAGIGLNTGHAYDGILSRNRAVFAEHPEYLGLVDGERKSTKFCISNPGLRQLVIDDALRRLEKDPAMDSVSVDPSDGGGWCECQPCAELGSVSDRAVLLANAVAAAVTQRYPGKLVGMYAYNFHSPPPAIDVHPAVVISVATAFLKGGITLDEILAGWSARGATLGIREYYSVNTWDRDLPAAARGGNLAYLQRTIPTFHQQGARFMSAEASDNWGPNGLGYYLAARMLWDVGQADQLDWLVEDFLSRAFGAAKEPMREFYRQLDGSRPHLVASDQLGRMFLALDEARRLEPQPEVQARLDDLLLYARYVHLYHRYAQAKGASRQQAFEALIRHAYRMRETMLVHVKALYRDLVNRDKSVTIRPEAGWNVPEDRNPWKSSRPFSQEELAAFRAEGIAANPRTELDFEPVAFSDDLVSAAPLDLPEVPPGQFGPGRGEQVFYTRVDKAPATIRLAITGGLIAHYRDRGNVRVELWQLGGASQTGEAQTLVGEDRSAPPDGQEHSVSLDVQQPGLYRIVVNDGNDRTRVRWDCPLPLTIESSADEPMNAHYTEPWQLYFYVPQGTQTIGLFGGEHGEVRDSAGRPVFWLNGRERNYYGVPVPDGEDGRLWSIRYGRGAVRLLTVPPYLARTAAELLLPAEVVARDGNQPSPTEP